MNCVLRFSSDSRFDCLLGLFAALLVPMSGVVTQGVEQDHPALDISCRVGRPVRAAHDGVGRSRWTATHGWTFHLAGAGVKTRYSHLNAGAPAGSYDRGQIIGLCGTRAGGRPVLIFTSKRNPCISWTCLRAPAQSS